MKEQRSSYLFRLFIAFILANLLFVLIFLSAYSISYLNYQSIRNSNNLIQKYINESKGYLESFECSDNLLYESSESLDVVGAKLNLLEERFGKNDKRVLEQKSLYSELEYEHFLIVKKLNSECRGNFITLLFFYSNSGDLGKESESTGYILGFFKKQDAGKRMIYSFDYNLDSGLISRLKMQYNITSAPVVVFNEREKVYVNSIDDLNALVD